MFLVLVELIMFWEIPLFLCAATFCTTVKNLNIIKLKMNYF